MISKTMEICTVEVCSCVCSYCPQKALQNGYKKLGSNPDFKNPKEMSWDIYTKCLSKLPKDVCIDFAGFVEPFHSSICADMICYAHDNGYKMRLFSTLSGMKLEDINKIRHIQFLDCCYHVPDNDNLLKVNVDDKYIEVVTEFIKHIQCSAHCFGKIHDKLKFITKSKHVEIKNLTEQHLINRGGNIKSNKIIQVREVKKTGKLWCKSPYMMFGDNAPLNFNVMDIYGNVYLCCCCFGLEHKLGNLLEDSYIDLFNSKEYNNVIRGLNGDESIDILCRTCDMSVSVK